MGGAAIASTLAVAGLAFIHHDWAGKAQMEKLAAMADDCIRKAGISADTKPDHAVTLIPLGTHYRLKTAFSITHSDGAESYSGKAHVRTAPVEAGRQKAGKPMIEFQEERLQHLDAGFNSLINGFPAHDGKYCVRLPADELVSCLTDHGWYEDEDNPGTLKSNKITQDVSGLALPDMALVSFKIADGRIAEAKVTTHRPGYAFEFNKGGATLDPALKQAGEQIGVCHTRVLESAFGPFKN